MYLRAQGVDFSRRAQKKLSGDCKSRYFGMIAVNVTESARVVLCTGCNRQFGMVRSSGARRDRLKSIHHCVFFCLPPLQRRQN